MVAAFKKSSIVTLRVAAVTFPVPGSVRTPLIGTSNTTVAFLTDERAEVMA
jgi:hypothetical protein